MTRTYPFQTTSNGSGPAPLTAQLTDPGKDIKAMLPLLSGERDPDYWQTLGQCTCRATVTYADSFMAQAKTALGGVRQLGRG